MRKLSYTKGEFVVWNRNTFGLLMDNKNKLSAEL